jgi:hypothetical protein
LTNERTLLAIDFGTGEPREFPPAAWREGMTIADLMRATPDIRVSQQGSGKSAFLTAIDDVANEGPEGKNWTYKVNGKTGDRSFAIYELKPDDRVLWTFGKRQ